MRAPNTLLFPISEFLKIHANSSESAVSCVAIAEKLQIPKGDVSGCLSSACRHQHVHLRRRKAEGEHSRARHVYWWSNRPSVKHPAAKRSESPEQLKNGVGIYFTQASGKDILLTLDEAKHLYDQMALIFQ